MLIFGMRIAIEPSSYRGTIHTILPVGGYRDASSCSPMLGRPTYFSSLWMVMDEVDGGAECSW
jgi:hypothetical protein